MEGNARSAFAIDHRNVAGDAELDLARYKVDLHERAPFEIESRSFNETSGDTQIENLPLEEQSSVRKKYLSTAFAGIARMTTAVCFQCFHCWRL